MTDSLAEFLDEDVVADAPAGTPSPFLPGLVKALLGRGHRVTVCALDPSVGDRVTLHGDMLTVMYGPYRQRHNMRDGMRAERAAVRGLIEEARPDLVNAHWAYEYALGALSSGYPTVVTVHDWGPAIVRYAPIPYWFARQLMYLRAVRRAPLLTAVSPYIYCRLKWITTRPITLIPNGVEAALFRAEARRSNTEEPLVISVNHGFQARKNVTSLLRAFRLVRQTIARCRMLLLGSGFEEEGPAHAWARARGLEEGVEFVGPVSNSRVLELLDSADLLVHPSREEAFGMTLIEAMARRTPVVAGRTSGAVPWVLDEGSAGVLADVTSPSDLAASMVALLEDQSLWEHYSTSGYRNAAKRFSMHDVVDRYLATYKRLLA